MRGLAEAAVSGLSGDTIGGIVSRVPRTPLVPFWLPLGDELVAECDGSLRFTDEMTAFFVGGPTQTATGRIFVTTRQLAFRPPAKMPHPQQLTVDLSEVTSVTRHRMLGIVPGRMVVAIAKVGGRPFELRFAIDDPARFVELLERARASTSPREPANVLLDAAMREGISVRGRYTSTLAALGFPQAHWNTEEVEELRSIVGDAITELGLPLPDAFVRGLDLAVVTETGPEDYETGPGSEAWGRREQIARIVAAVNAALPATEPRRFYTFAENLPGWPADEPICVLLTPERRDGLVRLGVVHPT